MQNRKSICENLEQRYLFSAVPAILLDSDLAIDDLAFEPVESTPEDETSPTDSDTRQVIDRPRELIIIDESVENFEVLAADITSNRDPEEFQWFIIRSGDDGIEQISNILSRQDGISAIHLVTHGAEGELQLGNSRLTINSLSGYASDLTGWRDSLTSEADLLIYGCDLASSSSGTALIESIGSLTGADVAASDDLTGHEELSGDWVLEYQVGAITTDIAFSEQLVGSFYYTLDITSNLVAHYEFDSDASSVANDSTANSNTGAYDNGENLVAGTVGTLAADFTGDAAGDNNVITVADDPTLDFSGDFSVAFWYNSSVTQTNSTRIIGSHDGSDGFFHLCECERRAELLCSRQLKQHDANADGWLH